MKNWETIADGDLFMAVLENVKEDTTLTITRENKYANDRFLILADYRPSMTITLKRHDLMWVYFDGDEPMLLEDCPKSFLRTIIKNL